MPECIACQGAVKEEGLQKESSDAVDRNVKSLSKKVGNLSLYARLHSDSDVHAGDMYYHRS